LNTFDGLRKWQKSILSKRETVSKNGFQDYLTLRNVFQIGSKQLLQA
jgi:hypothetical protein